MMRVGVPKEIKDSEFRVAASAEMVAELVHQGHEVTVEAGAGLGAGITDDAFIEAGARIEAQASRVWESSELVLKVKEPQQQEYGYLRPDLTLFTYLHLAADEALTDALLESGTTAIAYETVETSNGSLPLLIPMSEIAGRVSVQIGSFYLMRDEGGSGVLLSGVPGTRKGKVVIIGAGNAGESAALIASGMGAEVSLIDISLTRLRQLERSFGGHVNLLASSQAVIAREVASADLVIGSVLVPGARAPKLVTKEMVAQMRPGSVLVDIAIDQGGCFEGSHPTTHQNPTYKVHDAFYYCVANMPGAFPQTATSALTNATLPYVLRIANQGVMQALQDSAELRLGVNTYAGRLVNEQVALAFGRSWEILTLPRPA